MNRQFENYYRLAYLQAMEGLSEDALKTLGQASAVAPPNKVFSYILDKTVRRQLKGKKAVEIAAKDLSKDDSSKESYRHG